MRRRSYYSVIALSSILIACAAEIPDTQTNIAIVSGVHANFPFPDAYDSVDDYLRKAAESYGDWCVFISDGEPEEVEVDEKKRERPDSKVTKESYRKEIEANIKQMKEDIIKESANDTEVDTLWAIAEAANEIRNKEGKRLLLIIDSGLSTSGYINFKEGLFEQSEPKEEEIGEMTREKGITCNMAYKLKSLNENKNQLPDLNGFEVVWIGLGDTEYPQESLKTQEERELQNFWDEILTISGAESVTFDTDSPGKSEKNEKQSLPEVSVVDVYSDEKESDQIEVEPINVNDADSGELCEKLNQEGGMFFDNIIFRPESSEFYDKNAVIEVLKPLADCLALHPDKRIVLAGSTATDGSNEKRKELAKQRAEVVKVVLQDLGVNESQIVGIVGMGFEHQYQIKDTNDDGELIESKAIENRRVLIFNAYTVAGENILNGRY